ncbi:hypothetical protein BDZ91DRAFT_732481 [Kalaharituber pfeilii]|nr:hypothetical protein BDZ91DRAFT_732481 [Kalaharituber pfeilii]
MLEYLIFKKFRKNRSKSDPTNQSPAPTSTADAEQAGNESLTPLLAPQDEQFLAGVINHPDISVERSAEAENINDIFCGKPETGPVATAAATTTDAQPPVLETAPVASHPVPVSDGDWIEELKAKWGYLEALGSVSVTRLGQTMRKSKDKGKSKEKAEGLEAEGLEAEGLEDTQSIPATPTGVSTSGTATPTTTAAEPEIIREDKELTEILDRLDFAASHGRVLSSPSASLKPLINQFTQIIKDILTGVPTAYDDLVSLFDSSSSVLEKTYSSLPTYLKQLIAALPDKLTPEVLRTLAAASPALADAASGAAGLGLKDMVTHPGVLTGLLRAVVDVLRTRFPMLLGGGVAVGLGVFVLFFGLWYIYKRGKETREEREERERMQQFGVQRIKSVKELEKEKKAQEKEEKRRQREREKAEKQKTGGTKKRWWN